ELCRLVGQLAIFGDSRRPPSDLPQYDHDDLGGCFSKVRNYIDLLLDRIVEPEFKQRPFVGRGLRMQVELEPAWLEANYQMFVGVKTPLPVEESVRLWTTAKFDMKIGSDREVDKIFERSMAGLKFAHSPNPPRALPSIPGLIYFQIDRASEEWQNVRQSL